MLQGLFSDFSLAELIYIIPRPLPFLFIFVCITAMLGTVVAHVRAIYDNRHKWEPYPNSNLTYSYFVRTGFYQARLSYADAHMQIRQGDWIVGISGVAHKLGNVSCDSMIAEIILSVLYIFLATLGAFELFVRVLAGSVYLLLMRAVHTILLLVARFISWLARIVAVPYDKNKRLKQYCPYCYESFDLPRFRCDKDICDNAHDPEVLCTLYHDRLTPSKCGVFIARCKGGTFLPAMAKKRSLLRSYCAAPKLCRGDFPNQLAASNPVQLFIHLIGGTGAGKTAYMGAFNHAYRNTISSDVIINDWPKEDFNQLSSELTDGHVEKTFGRKSYNFTHRFGDEYWDASDNLIFFDIEGSAIANNEYEQWPANYGFCHGFMLFFDPFSVSDLRSNVPGNEYHPTGFDVIITQFVNKYHEIIPGPLVLEPVAIIITKKDMPIVASDLKGTTEDQCIDYLESLRQDNALRLIDANFKNVRYFCISSSLSSAEADPASILAPVQWIMQEAGSHLADIIE